MKLKNINKIVNKFDKSFGINVKDIPIFDNLYNSSTVFETSVKKMICIINGINPDYMVKTDINEKGKLFTQKQKVKKSTSKTYTFPELSSLKWDRTGMYSIKSNIFRKRWLTLILTDILQNSETIANHMVDAPHSEEELSIIKLSHIQKDLEHNALKNTYTSKMFFIELAYYIDKRKHKVMNKAAQIIDSMVDVSHNASIKKRSEDFMLFYISTLAYMLTTSNGNSKLKFHLIESFRLGDDATEFIKYLGKLISENQLSYSFNAFINASPKIYSKDESREYKIGIASLEFIRFIFSDDKYICRYIGKVID